MDSEVLIKAKLSKQASYKAAILSAKQREEILIAIAESLKKNRIEIKSVNQKDMIAGKEKGLSDALLDRLLLNDNRINGMIQGIQEVIAMEDKLGYMENTIKRPNGLLIGQMFVPLGVIAIIYESRPNVTVDAAVLCIKSGNTILLRGGSEAIHSNIYLTKIMKEAAESKGFPEGGISIVENTSHALVDELVTLRKFIDVLIPRGSARFIEHIVGIAKVPIIETGDGNCHVYVDKNSDLKMATEIIFNGKTQRPSVCNATKKVLIHQDVADAIFPLIIKRLGDAGVIFLTDERTEKYFAESPEEKWKLSSEEEWYEEFLDMRLGIKIVDSLEGAIAHINEHSSHHTEAIITKEYARATQFINSIDSASLFWNASTRFTDGGQFGVGSEIGISTQKLHWRGPMSVYQLMSKKFVTYGTGQIRK